MSVAHAYNPFVPLVPPHQPVFRCGPAHWDCGSTLGYEQLSTAEEFEKTAEELSASVIGQRFFHGDLFRPYGMRFGGTGKLADWHYRATPMPRSVD